MLIRLNVPEPNARKAHENIDQGHTSMGKVQQFKAYRCVKRWRPVRC